VLTYIPMRALLIFAFCNLVAMSSAANTAATTDDTFKGSRQLRKTTERALSDINKYVSQLDHTERALSQVSKADDGNLRKRYESFSRAISDLEKAQERTTAEIGKMRSVGTEYFSSWDRANIQIQDQELRLASARRRAIVVEKHRALADALSEIGVELPPFMSHLHDIKSFLGADLSLANIAKAKEMIEESRIEANALKERIKGVKATLEEFLKSSIE
jgi:Protein of unknown function (DUF2959)